MTVVVPSNQRPFASTNRTKLVNLVRKYLELLLATKSSVIFHSPYFEFCMYMTYDTKDVPTVSCL